MKTKYKGIEFVYDEVNDNCYVSSNGISRTFENPLEGYNFFVGELSYELRMQLVAEMQANGRNRFTGLKE